MMLGERHCSYILWVKLPPFNKLIFPQMQLCTGTLTACSLGNRFHGCL